MKNRLDKFGEYPHRNQVAGKKLALKLVCLVPFKFDFE
jgi:hypothetical protein